MAIGKELKDFMMRGNVVDMAVGVVVGGAFGKIVTSLVNDVIMPPVGILVGGVNFTDLKFVLKATEGVESVTLNYGSFLQTIFDFIIISTAIFFAIKAMNTVRTQKDEPKVEATPPKPTKEEVLLGEIRDLLKEKNK